VNGLSSKRLVPHLSTCLIFGSQLVQQALQTSLGSALPRSSASIVSSASPPSSIAPSTPLISDKPGPQKYIQENFPQIKYWFYRDWKADNKAQRGETDGLSTMPKKRGRPSAKAGDKPRHIYLQKEDGSYLAADELGAMGVKARRLFQTFKRRRMVADSFSKLPSDAFDYYVVEMNHEFPWFGYADSSWKLEIWSSRVFSAWKQNRGLEESDSESHGCDDEADAEEQEEGGEEEGAAENTSGVDIRPTKRRRSVKSRIMITSPL
jgi:hypothetical protein